MRYLEITIKVAIVTLVIMTITGLTYAGTSCAAEFLGCRPGDAALLGLLASDVAAVGGGYACGRWKWLSRWILGEP